MGRTLENKGGRGPRTSLGEGRKLECLEQEGVIETRNRTSHAAQHQGTPENIRMSLALGKRTMSGAERAPGVISEKLSSWLGNSYSLHFDLRDSSSFLFMPQIIPFHHCINKTLRKGEKNKQAGFFSTLH